jgi:hypothetical protein
VTELCEFIREDAWECNEPATIFVVDADPSEGFKQACNNHRHRLVTAWPGGTFFLEDV